jgi:peptidoglycan/LPS O-acetylase OafA/YrhL
LVVLFHFGLSWLPGGFLGVDMFFVLSGFLITSLLIREHSATGKLNLRLFWRGRARRLFPALGLLLVVVALVALSDGALEQLTVFQQGIATLLYVNNWWLIFTDTPYFNALQQPSPLLHTGSLGVEEQWYLVFPLLMLAALTLLARLGRRSGPVPSTEPANRTPLPFKRLGIGLGVLALCSTAWGAALAGGGASFDRLYFGTDVRAQELLVGSALACLYRGPDWGRRAATNLSDTAGLVGVGVLALLALLASENSRWLFSGGMMALSLAVAAIIWSSAQPAACGSPVDLATDGYIGRSPTASTRYWPLGLAGREGASLLRPRDCRCAAAVDSDRECILTPDGAPDPPRYLGVERPACLGHGNCGSGSAGRRHHHHPARMRSASAVANNAGLAPTVSSDPVRRVHRR